MKKKPSVHRLIQLVCTLLLLETAGVCANDNDSIAFFYGVNPPLSVLSQFDRLVLEPDNVKPDEHDQLKRNGTATFAYVSIGEIGPSRAWYNQIPDSASFGRNNDWNSKVMDLTNIQWQRLFLQRVTDLVSRGYNGLFLDTMDSYLLYANTPKEKIRQQKGLSNLVYRIKRKHPNIRLIANRGFEVVDQIAPYLEAVAAESLYAGWNNAQQRYIDVKANDRQWLHNKLTDIKKRHNLDIIVIDYLPPSERSKARDVAAKIVADGFIPWVANPALDYVGIGTLEVLPREVLMLFDTRSNGDIYGAIENAEVHTLLAMPLEYMGYVPIYLDLAKNNLPSGVLKGKYAGIIIWHREPTEAPGYAPWVEAQFTDQIPISFFGSIGIKPTESIMNTMGITKVSAFDGKSLQTVKTDRLIGFESQVPPRTNQFSHYIKSDSSLNSTHLTFADKNGIELDTVISGPWGGLALSPTIINLDIDKRVDWILDPFTFLKKSLLLPDAPMPDITTENGARLWFAHIHGDALPSWAEMPERKLGAEVLYDEILKTADLPHTVSIVEAEITGIDAYTDRRERMINIARKIFALNTVEIASHTYSHPYNWQQLTHGDPSGKKNLRLPGYRYDLEREIGGSVNYIDTFLAPPDKKTKILLWSGDAYPPGEALEIVEKHGLLNMNGGLTRITKAMPSMAAISANARLIDGRIQVYAPIMNENIYTNDWLGPFDGFRDVLETFTMTDFPRRIKPVNIYYHFYIGTKTAALRSLKEVYNWTEKQSLLHPVFSSEYIVKVPEFRSAGVARYLDGRWKVSGLGSIRSLRILKHNEWPDLRSTRSVIGARKLHDGIYIHTNGQNTVSFRTKTTRPQQPHLVASNARVRKWTNRRNGQLDIRMSGHTPVVIELNGDKRYCDIRSQNTVIRGQMTSDGNTRYNFQTKDTGDAVINCET